MKWYFFPITKLQSRCSETSVASKQTFVHARQKRSFCSVCLCRRELFFKLSEDEMQSLKSFHFRSSKKGLEEALLLAIKTMNEQTSLRIEKNYMPYAVEGVCELLVQRTCQNFLFHLHHWHVRTLSAMISVSLVWRQKFPKLNKITRRQHCHFWSVVCNTSDTWVQCCQGWMKRARRSFLQFTYFIYDKVTYVRSYLDMFFLGDFQHN